MRKSQRKILLAAALIVLFGSFFIDLRVFNFFNSIQIQLLTNMFKLIEPNIFMVTVIVSAGFFIFLKRKEGIINFISAVVLTFLSVFALKLLIGRERPLGEMLSFGIQDFSFPSAHAALSFCLFAFYAREFKKFALVWLSIAVVISFSRIYISAHYLSDVIAGALIGYCIGLYCAENEKRQQA